MSLYHGKMDNSKKNGRPNKGVARMMRDVKRTEAEARNALSDDTTRRSYARSQGFSRVSDLAARDFEA